MVGVAVIVLIFAGWMIHKTWTLGDAENDYEIVCLGGHEYYRANFAAKGFLGIKLDDNGKPCKCE
jgi:hypothetical protein